MRYIANFSKSRKNKIGASEISILIKHPNKYESLAGYGQTPQTLYQIKKGLIEKPQAGYEAHMGNVLEPIVLYEFISQRDKESIAKKTLQGYMLCEFDKQRDGYPTAPQTQYTNYLHHTESENEFAVAHADCIKESKNEYTIIEAKTAKYWSSKRRDDVYSGYDFDMAGHQGIPLRNYFQIQFQAAIYQEEYGKKIDNAFLALLCDTSRFNVWEIKIDRRVQERTLELAHYFHMCMKKNKPPKELAMNKTDIAILYPKLDEDFVVISGEELQFALQAAQEGIEADRQMKAWKQKKEDAENALSIFLKNAKVLRGIVDSELQDIATWQERSGGERLVGLSEIKKDKRLYNYCKKNKLIKEIESSRFIKIKYKGEDNE